MGTTASSCERPLDVWLKMQQDSCERFNKTRQEPVDFDCPKCLNRGLFLYCNPQGYIYSVPCECQSLHAARQSLKLSGMEDMLRRFSFQAFQNWSPWAQSMKAVALEWAKSGKGWLLLCGQPGSGKTHLALAACGYRLGRRGQRMEFLSWREFVEDQMKGGEGRREDMETKKKAELLYVDDLFKTSRSRKEINPWEIDIFFELVNYRYNNRLDTVITTERSPAELLRSDEAIGSRLIEMAGKHLFTVDRNPEKNYRLKSRAVPLS